MVHAKTYMKKIINKIIKKSGINKHLFFMTPSMFMTGAAGMVGEYVLSTVSSYLNGTQIESFSLTIAIMLGMMGIGGFTQRFVSSEKLIEKFIYLEITLAIASGFAPIAVYAAFSYTPEHFQLVYYFFAMLIGFLVGFEIPLITRANEKYTTELKDNLSLVFLADYVGAFVGALFWVYFLLPYMDIVQIGFVLAVLNFAVAVMTYVYFKNLESIKVGLGVLFGIFTAACFLVFGYFNAVDWAELVEQKMYPDPIVEIKKTKYQKLTITHSKTNDDIRLYINNNTQFSSTDEVRYHEMLIHLPIAMLDGVPKKALMLGGGDGLAAREMKKYHGLEIDVIELDKEMFYWAKKQPELLNLNKGSFLDFKEHEMSGYSGVREAIKEFDSFSGNNVFFTDASNFVNAFVQMGKEPVYDIIILDLPDPYSLGVNKMYTKQFYSRAMRMLKDGGVLVTQATSPFHSNKAFNMIGRTLKASGFNAKPYWQNIPSFGEWGWWVASKGELKYNKIKAKTSYLTNALAESSFNFGKNTIHENGDINTLMSPKLVQIYNKSWVID